jgi:hypothetical protein
VAQEVNAATGTGLLLPTGLSGITCDVNSSADTSVPAETFTEGVFSDYSSNIEDFGGGGGGGDGEEFGDGDPMDGNPDDGKDNQQEGSFDGYPAPGDGRYPPSAPAGIEPIPMGNGQPAPGYPPTEWIPGTWSSTYEIPAHQDSIYGDLDPGTPGLQCGIVQVNNIPGTGIAGIPGPCWGLYQSVTYGLCGAPSSIVWYTAVIGDGFSYWQTVATFGGGTYGANTINPVIANVFTPA